MRFPEDGVDIIQVTLDWTAPLERLPFEAAWQAIARRHEILRTSFRLDDAGRLVQVVDPDASIDIRWRTCQRPRPARVTTRTSRSCDRIGGNDLTWGTGRSYA